MIVRGVATIEETEGGNRGDRIIVTELPYQVNKAQWITAIADMVKDKKIDGISDIRDESDKDGIRVVFELRKGTMSAVILNNLYKYTALESSFWASNLAIVDNQPRSSTSTGLLENFVHHRIEVIRRRSEFDLKKAQEKVHILIGLLIALSKIDLIIAAIRASDSVDNAQTALILKFGLDEPQANAILQMQLRRLAALEQQKINDEKKGLETEICTARDYPLERSKHQRRDPARDRRDRGKVRRRPENRDRDRYQRSFQRGPDRGQERPYLASLPPIISSEWTSTPTASSGGAATGSRA